MIDDHPDLERRYRAPRAFGPMPGPRNIPLSQREVASRPDEVTTSISVSLEADPEQLTRLLPPDTRLSTAVLTVTATRFEHLLWLAGRGYPILTVTIPVEYVGSATGEPGDAPLPARYLAVLWEGLADPVTTGREELGFPKLYADIAAPSLEEVPAEGPAAAHAAWDGFRFVDLAAEDWRDLPLEDAATPLGTLVHRYVPSVDATEVPDVDHLVYHARGGPGAARPTVTHRRSGTGRFAFHHARFEDAPVQYPVINNLAALTLAPPGPATLLRTTSAPGRAPGTVRPRQLGAARPQPAAVSG